MARNGFFTGLDIGTSSIKVLVAEFISIWTIQFHGLMTFRLPTTRRRTRDLSSTLSLALPEWQIKRTLLQFVIMTPIHFRILTMGTTAAAEAQGAAGHGVDDEGMIRVTG